jgi:uncharacterized protein
MMNENQRQQIPLNFRILAALLHAICALLPITSLPITWIIWFATRNQHPFVDRSGRSALNFQTSLFLYLFVVAGLLGVVCGVLPTNVGQSFIAIITFPAIFLAIILMLSAFLLPIVAAVLAMYGRIYSYPLTVKFLSELP